MLGLALPRSPTERSPAGLTALLAAPAAIGPRTDSGTRESAMQPRRLSLCELVWTVVATAIFLGVMKAIPFEVDRERILLVCWVLLIVVVRLLFGWLAGLFVSAAFGAAICGLFVFLAGQSNPAPPLAGPMLVALVFGIVAGSVMAGLVIAVGWLIHQLARTTIRLAFTCERSNENESGALASAAKDTIQFPKGDHNKNP